MSVLSELFKGKIKVLVDLFLKHEKTDKEFYDYMLNRIEELAVCKSIHETNILMLDLFYKAGFKVIPEFDGKSWVVVA